MLRFNLAALHYICFDKCIIKCSHNYSIIQNTFNMQNPPILCLFIHAGLHCVLLCLLLETNLKQYEDLGVSLPLN